MTSRSGRKQGVVRPNIIETTLGSPLLSLGRVRVGEGGRRKVTMTREVRERDGVGEEGQGRVSDFGSR